MYKAFLSDGGHILYPERGGRLDRVRSLHNKLCGAVCFGPTFEEFKDEYFGLKNLHNTVPDYDFGQELAKMMHSYGWKSFESSKKQTKARKLELRPGVTETLELLLCSGVPFVCLTDAPLTSDKMLEWYREYFRNKQGQDLVTKFITSIDLGVEKPHSKFFEAGIEEVQKHVKTSKEGIAFIAHDVDEIVGAHEYGLDTVAMYVSEEDKPLVEGKVTHWLTDFSELKRLI